MKWDRQNEKVANIEKNKRNKKQPTLFSKNKGKFPVWPLSFPTPERKDSSHSWRLWTRSSTTMEGTPISGAASGWRRWRVCDPSLTETSCGVFQCRGNWRGDDAWVWQIFLIMTPSSGLHTPKHTLLSRFFGHSLILWYCKTALQCKPFWLMTENSWRKWEQRWGGEVVKSVEYPFKGCRLWITGTHCGVKSVGLANWVTTSWATETGRLLHWGSVVAGWCGGFSDPLSPFWLPINLYFCKSGCPTDSEILI